jgi:tRNA threonylcarbamoyl adenosine modification protein (Sua5/YciO/YrdC/YwlC family)
VSRFFDCAVALERARGLQQAEQAARRHQLVVLPTDTVYGIGCDAFSPTGVRALLAAKGRGRDLPVPVLVGSPGTLDGLAATLTQQVRDLVEAFWPGPLTVVCRQAPSLVWDLGDTDGTVAVRMPLHPVAIELLRAVGPMAVSSANRSGQPPAMTLDEAVQQLGDAVDVYLDGGPSASALPSSIVDVTGPVPRLLRVGVLDADTIRSVAPGLEAG